MGTFVGTFLKCRYGSVARIPRANTAGSLGGQALEAYWELLSDTLKAARFRDAIDIARKQDAKSFELRATTGLARLLRDTNRRDEARAMLAEIYGWFIEGFDTADLKDAKALLVELGA